MCLRQFQMKWRSSLKSGKRTWTQCAEGCETSFFCSRWSVIYLHADWLFKANQRADIADSPCSDDDVTLQTGRTRGKDTWQLPYSSVPQNAAQVTNPSPQLNFERKRKEGCAPEENNSATFSTTTVLSSSRASFAYVLLLCCSKNILLAVEPLNHFYAM